MAAYSLGRLDLGSSALITVLLKVSYFRTNLEKSLKEAVYNLLLWVRDNDDRSVDDLKEGIDPSLFTQQQTLTFKAEFCI